MDFVDIFKALGDITRMRIVNLLLKNEMCVCEIETILGITQSNASRHLTRLKIAGIIDYDKKSQWIYYRISNEFMSNNERLYQYLLKMCSDESKFERDNKRLQKYKNNNCSCNMIRENKEKVLDILNKKCVCKSKI